jgi:hypothetical protein
MTWFARFVSAMSVAVAAIPAIAQELRLNQIQVIGTHNSYHIAPAPAIRDLITSLRKGWFESIDYTHRPLAEQFEQLKIRQIELDVFADPEGGLFASPAGRKLAKANGDLGPDPNADGTLSKPGFKVLHVQDVDFRSTVPTFRAGLEQIRAWSKSHPRHVPIMVLVELKDSAIGLLPTKPVPFDAKLFDAVDDEIRSVFPKDHLIDPDSVRGTSATVKDAIRDRGWPALESSRGKVLFLLDNEGRIGELYRKDRPSLRGRAMFALCPENDPAAVCFKLNDPVGQFEAISKAVRSGALVRTRADADTAEARKNDTTRRDKALASGAQFVSTDFPEVRKDWSDYRVTLPGDAVARPNPVIAPGVKVTIKE